MANYSSNLTACYTAHHAKYFANELSCHSGSDDPSRLSQALLDAKVELNPHQIEAALFALKNPLQQGVLLADEVGLGKTIEASLVLCQLWAERKRQLLVVCPAALRKQWANELADKFNLPAMVVDKKVIKNTRLSPALFFNEYRNKQIFVVSYQFIRQYESLFTGEVWDCLVIDEVHNLRNTHQKSNKIGQALRKAFNGRKKLLLSATPLQNSPLDLFGISLLLDEHLFGDKKQFNKYFNKNGDIPELKTRLTPFVQRTLRQDVLEYIKYTKRQTITQSFEPTQAEQDLYNAVSAFLSRPHSYALPKQQRHLTGLILRKLLASSPLAIIGTLETIKARLVKMQQSHQPISLDKNWLADEEFEDYLTEEFEEDFEQEKADNLDITALQSEIKELDRFIKQANALQKDSKILALLTALEQGFAKMKELGASQKAIIFTESVRTQQYLLDFLTQNGYAENVVGFNGSNTGELTNQIYQQWLKENQGSNKITGSAQVDKRTALIEHFRDNAQIMVATEAGAEGVNLQFCSLLINYDLPWNPQRIEQRIGRCHRYGQKFDVVVINMLNQRNLADQRVLQLLTEKFRLFNDVFGASDEILGRIESGVDFESRILTIYDRCRTAKEIENAFNQLQVELESEIKHTLAETQEKLFNHFDEEVRERLKLCENEVKQRLSLIQRYFWQLSRVILADYAQFDEQDYRFILKQSPISDAVMGRYRLSEKEGEHYHRHRLNSPLGEWCIKQGLDLHTPIQTLHFNLSQKQGKLSLVEERVGQTGWLKLDKLIIQSESQTQEQLIFTACTDQGEWLDQAFCVKLFELPANVQHSEKMPPLTLSENSQVRIDSAIHQATTKNDLLLKQEMIRLRAYFDDLIEALGEEIDNAKIEKRQAENQANQVQSVQEQIEWEEKIGKINRRLRRLRNEREDKEDELENEHCILLQKMKNRLTQQSSVQELFVVRWVITSR
ncbi:MULTISPECIES: SNF2-related protein [Rodentibacter]|uniref:SNF2-related protein n=1 Tax=Rodentibacter TaxID=1960084 RepID=UPI001CFF0B44|nr:SNF2-related protein [Rodentibacter sp. JRC1]GJI56922.1 helicase SNF2 [Rodentibacter sp. JRC1]